MAGLRELWTARSPRERRVVAGGVAAVVVALLWAYGWSPLQEDRARLARDLPQLRADAAQVAAGVQEAARLRGAAQRTDAAGAAAAIETRAREAFAGAFGAVAAAGDDRYRLALQPVAFDVLARYLGTLAAEHGIVVEQLALAPHDDAGRVAVESLVLRTPPQP